MRELKRNMRLEAALKLATEMGAKVRRRSGDSDFLVINPFDNTDQVRVPDPSRRKDTPRSLLTLLRRINQGRTRSGRHVHGLGDSSQASSKPVPS